MGRNMKFYDVGTMMSSQSGEFGIWLKGAYARKFTPLKGSLDVVNARLMGLSYVDYLRMARDKYNARLAGKGHLYIKVYFKDKQDAINLANELDKRFGLLISKLGE